jgi:hypothetical protein
MQEPEIQERSSWVKGAPTGMKGTASEMETEA